MVDDEVTDGTRLAQLLSSEIHGHGGGSLGRLSVVDADTDVDPTTDGAFAFAVAFDREEDVDGDGTETGASERSEHISEVYVHLDHARVAFEAATETAARAAEENGLGVRRDDDGPGRTHVLVANGAEVKDALRVVRRVADERRQQTG